MSDWPPPPPNGSGGSGSARPPPPGKKPPPPPSPGSATPDAYSSNPYETMQATRKGSLPPPVPASLLSPSRLSYGGSSADCSPAPPPPPPPQEGMPPISLDASASPPSTASHPASSPVQPRPPPRPLLSGQFPPPVPRAHQPQPHSTAPPTPPAALSPAPHAQLGSTPPPPPPPMRSESPVSDVAYSPNLAAASSSVYPHLSPSPDPPIPATRPRCSVMRPPPVPSLQHYSSKSSLQDDDSRSSSISADGRPAMTHPVPAATANAAAAAAAATSPKAHAEQQWIDPNYKPSFAQKLHHKFDVVVEQSNAGMYLLKRVRAFMQRFSNLQERYAQELAKITSMERSKLMAAPGRGQDGMSSCAEAWAGFFSQMDGLAQANLAFSQDLKEVTVEQLEKFHTIGTSMVKENKVEQERVSAHMLKVNLSVAKERDLANQALQKLASKRCDSSASDAAASASAAGGVGSSPHSVTSPMGSGAYPPASSSSSSGGAKKAALSMFKSAPNPVRSFEKSKEASMRACESYATAIQSANLQHHKYHSEDLPGMLTQMQSLEEMRLHSLNSALKDFSKLQASFTNSMLRLTQVVEGLAKKMNAHEDIQRFVQRTCQEHGPALAPLPFTYDLPLSLAELKAMTYDEPPSSLFYSTLEGVMKQQKSLEAVPGSTAHALSTGGDTTGAAGRGAGGLQLGVSRAALDLPLIVPTLLRHIISSGGAHSEGIFRISVGSDELTRLRRQLEGGDFSLANIQPNPHVSACLLKSWFRDLLHPIVPWALYDRAIALGQLEPFSAANPVHAAHMRSLLTELPPLHAHILALLFGFLKRMASDPAVVAKTRMNLANLSLVFSPGLVRSEKNDPLQMLQDTKYASAFVLRAVECTPACFSADAQAASARLLTEIFADANVQPTP